MSTHIVGEHDRSVESLLGRRDDLATSRAAEPQPLSPFDAGPGAGIRSYQGWDYQYVEGDPAMGIAGHWERIGETGSGSGGSGGGSSSSWSGTYVNDALTAASQAISSFLSGQSLADARKLAAAEQFQSMAQWALPPGVQPPGWGEGEARHQMAALQGRTSYTPPPNERRTVNPADLINAGQVPADLMQFIDNMLDTTDQGKVVVTGGSSSSS